MPKFTTIFFLLCLISFSGCTSEDQVSQKQGQTASGTRVVLTAPLPGQSIRHDILNDHIFFASNFEYHECQFFSTPTSLFLNFDNGGHIELVNFFSPEINNDSIEFEDKDGYIIRSADLLQAIHPDLDRMNTGGGKDN